MQIIRSFFSSSLLIAALSVAAPAVATTYELAEGTPVVFGAVEHYITTYEDTFTDIARRFSLGYEEIARANPSIDPWLPGAGKDLMIPGRRILPSGPREGIIVNLPEHRLYYFPKRKKKETPIVITYPVSIGKMDWHTPLGTTRVASKQKNPSWFPPDSVRQEHAERGEPLPAVVGPGPDNPLGAFAMRLAITPGAYLIHGTNNPLAVGMAVTHGCMRMYPEDVEALFPLVPVGTKVTILNEPVKIAFVDGEVLLEVHPPIDAEGQTLEPDLNQLSPLLDQALGATTAAVHWDFARQTMQLANGLPTVVGIEADLDVSPEALPEGPAQPEATDPAVVAAPAAPSAPIAVAEPTPVAPAQTTMPASPASVTAPADAPAAATLPAPAAPAQPPAPTTLPAPAAPAAAQAPSSSSARSFPAGDPDAATASPAESPPPANSGTTIATATDHP